MIRQKKFGEIYAMEVDKNHKFSQEIEDIRELLFKCELLMTKEIWQLWLYEDNFVFDYKNLFRLYNLIRMHKDFDYEELVDAFKKLGDSYNRL